MMRDCAPRALSLGAAFLLCCGAAAGVNGAAATRDSVPKEHPRLLGPRQRLQRLAAGDKGDLVTGLRQPGAKVTADRTGTDDRYPHTREHSLPGLGDGSSTGALRILARIPL